MEKHLKMKSCPNCGISKPLISHQTNLQSNDYDGNVYHWKLYSCSNCGGMLLAKMLQGTSEFEYLLPSPEKIDDSFPFKAKSFLEQAIQSIHAPSGAIMLCASSVDAMLKDKDLLEGSLYSRIDKANEDNLITHDMAAWAHEVRLNANNERHADIDADLPNASEARKTIEFVKALGFYLFTLPSRIKKGLQNAKK